MYHFWQVIKFQSLHQIQYIWSKIYRSNQYQNKYRLADPLSPVKVQGVRQKGLFFRNILPHAQGLWNKDLANPLKSVQSRLLAGQEKRFLNTLYLF